MSDILKKLDALDTERNPADDSWDGYDIAEEAIAEIKKLRGEVVLLNKVQKLSNSDWAETDTAVRERARKVLSEMQVEGDSYGVPPIEEIVDLLVAEVERLRTEKADDWKACCESARLAAGKIMTLRSAVERLRLTKEERQLLEEISESPSVPDCYHLPVAAIIKRQEGGK